MKHIKYFLVFVLFFSCKNENSNSTTSDNNSKLFTLLNSNSTKVKFQNNFIEDKNLNFINYPYIYNGGGVAVGDINNDGLTDLYFTSNQGSNKLYLNSGGFKFQDITSKANIKDEEGWSAGVTMVDINNDGYLDIYVCKSGSLRNDDLRKNKLYINQKDNTFKENAKTYGLDHAGYSVQAYFFDFDLDNDLDMYLVNHRKDFENSSKLDQKRNSLYRENESDQLFRNDNGKFTNITKTSGIANRAWGLSASIGDFNNDNLPDIYVANDFILSDFLYINKGDGTFKNEILTSFNHVSYNSMGSDFADINNDLLPDLIVLDMLAEDHIRGKENMATMSTNTFWGVVASGNHYQYMSNMMQLNSGNSTFSEIGQLSGIAKTDWSWAPLIADLDNDGFNDLLITNGIENDLTNQDFRKQISEVISKNKRVKLKQSINLMPSSKLSNYVYKNKGDLSFNNTTKAWGLDKNVNSNGAVYTDLDNDGDLDLVINNQLETASIYRNNSKNNSISFSFKGSQNNNNGIGVKAFVYNDDKKQVKQLYTSRGFQSSVDYKLVFGLNKSTKIDSVIVQWPDCSKQKLLNLDANKEHLIDYTNAELGVAKNVTPNKNFEKIEAQSLGIDYKHRENYFNDYKLQLLLPQKQSEQSFALAVGDINNDGLDDFFVGNAQGSEASMYIQNKNGTFYKVNKELLEQEKIYEDTNAKFIDIDNDNDLDLYITSGGYNLTPNSSLLQDRLYINNGKGIFTKSSSLPQMLSNTKAIASSDFNNDGDVDLFIAGRVKNGQYPLADNSFFLENKDGVFVDKTQDIFNDVSALNMANDALFTDFDNDGDLDLIVVGEWMPIAFFENNNGKFNKKEFENLNKINGWFQSITVADIDKDGYTDYIIGNYGLNNKFKPTQKKPLHIYADYLDDNNSFDVVLSKVSKTGDLLPVRGKECSTEQIPDLGEKIKTYKEFASLTLPEIYGNDKLSSAKHLQAHTFSTMVLKNKNGSSFETINLPNQAQFAPTLSSLLLDVNNDGILDIVGVGSVHEAEVETIRYDASKGYVLLQDNNGAFKYNANYSQFTDKEAKAIKPIVINKQNYLIILSKNEGLEFIKFK